MGNTLYDRPHFRYCLFLIVLGTLVYGNHLKNPFQYDTIAYIVNENRLENINEQLTISYLLKDFFHRSLLQISIAFNANLDGLNTFSYHLINLLLHLINSLLVYFVTFKAWRYLKLVDGKCIENETRFISLFSAVLFLLHPIQTESVIYVMSRSEIFAGTFYLNAFLIFQIYLDKNGYSKISYKILVFFIISVIFILGFSVKQTLVTLPLMLLLYFLFGQKSESVYIRWLSRNKWKIGIIALAGSVILFNKLLTDESFLIGPSSAGEDIGRLNYILTQPSVILFYYSKLLLFPINLNIDPDILLVTEWWSWNFFIALLGIVGLIYFFYQFKEKRLLLYFLFWFLIVLSPSSSIITLNDLAAEHRTYLASYSYYVIVAFCIYKLSHSVYSDNFKKGKNLALLVSICISILLSILTIKRNQIWTSEVSLWADTLKKSPKKIRPLINLAHAYTVRGNFNLAVEYYEKALALNPNIFATNYNLANLYFANGREEDGLQLLQTAALIRPKRAEVHGLLGEVYLKQKKIEKAEFHLKQAVKLKPEYDIAMRNLGIVYYFHLKKPEKAAVFFSRALSINPNQENADNIRILIKQIRNKK
jgi:protein O-mannosyl-transferase